jgi:hypothetical protein
MHPQTNAIGDPSSVTRLNSYSVALSLNGLNTVIVANAQLKHIYSTNDLYTPLTRYKLDQVASLHNERRMAHVSRRRSLARPLKFNHLCTCASVIGSHHHCPPLSSCPE